MDQQQKNFKIFLEISLCLIVIFSTMMIKKEKDAVHPVSSQFTEIENPGMSFSDLGRMIEERILQNNQKHR